MNYDNIEVQKAIPDASSMIETFRAIGYNLETAVADIIDNSISAGAKNIYIQRFGMVANQLLPSWMTDMA